MINKINAICGTTETLYGVRCVRGVFRWGPGEVSKFVGVLGCGWGDYYTGAKGEEGTGCILEVGYVSLDDFCLVAVLGCELEVFKMEGGIYL